MFYQNILFIGRNVSYLNYYFGGFDVGNENTCVWGIHFDKTSFSTLYQLVDMGTCCYICHFNCSDGFSQNLCADLHVYNLINMYSMHVRIAYTTSYMSITLIKTIYDFSYHHQLTQQEIQVTANSKLFIVQIACTFKCIRSFLR